MALQLTKELDTGANAEYWSILELRITETEIIIKLQLHVSQAAKIAGKSAIHVINKRMEHTKANTATANIYQKAYNEIKKSDMVDDVEQNEFASALDV